MPKNNNKDLDTILPILPEISLDASMNFSTPVYWGVQDKDRKQFDKLMAEAKSLVTPGFFFGDNLFTWARNNSFLEDIPFKKAWEANLANASDSAIIWRRYILACSAYHCLHLSGDFTEFGVYTGTGIKTVLDYLGGTKFPKTFWGYDTFDSNPVEGHEFSEQKEGFFEKVQTRFQDYPQVKLIKGFVPDSFELGVPDSIAYMHIDLNNYKGEIAVLDSLFERVVIGGIIILDDYEWSGFYREQKQKEDQWFDKRGYRIFPLPTGQGLIIKR
ncbi:MAG: TylF/MycF/NovP-related O-methyltransferase [Methylophilaceae bacterium]|jgi:O-methyltransferase|nr:TylF/MycF/NovP-related O-methyltransferase [Methylophilaceae bacterium]